LRSVEACCELLTERELRDGFTSLV